MSTAVSPWPMATGCQGACSSIIGTVRNNFLCVLCVLVVSFFHARNENHQDKRSPRRRWFSFLVLGSAAGELSLQELRTMRRFEPLVARRIRPFVVETFLQTKIARRDSPAPRKWIIYSCLKHARMARRSYRVRLYRPQVENRKRVAARLNPGSSLCDIRAE